MDDLSSTVVMTIIFLFHVAKIVFFIDTAKFSGKKHRRAGECQGAKKNEEKDTKKRKPRGLPFPGLFFKKFTKGLFASPHSACRGTTS